MSQRVEYRDVACAGFFEGLNLSAEAGSSVMVVTSREDESEQILLLAAGLILPSSGDVLLNGECIREMPYQKLIQARQTLGLIPSGGGLVSNLKLWENIMLPELYHGGGVSQSAENYALEQLERSGYSGNTMALPAHLSLYEKRTAAFIRAALRGPDTLICSHTLESISATSRARLAEMITSYQHSAGSAVIYLSDSPVPPAGISFDTVVTVH